MSNVGKGACRRRALAAILCMVLALLLAGAHASKALAGAQNTAVPASLAASSKQRSSAKGERTAYTVTFESNGGTPVESQVVKKGDVVEPPDDPTRDGYAFVGWYVDGALRHAYDFSIPVAGPITLHARWEKVSIADATVTLNETSYTYDGTAKLPIPAVTVDGKELRAKSDFLVAYKNNIEVGTASITVTGRGLYMGQVRKEFEIRPATFTVTAPEPQAYTGRPILAMPAVRSGSRTLSLGGDCALRWRNNTDIGTGTVTVVGKGNYAGTTSVTFRIAPASIRYRVRLQDVGNEEWRSDGQVAGLPGGSKTLEGLFVDFGSAPHVDGDIEYRMLLDASGWERSWKKQGAMSGALAQAQPADALQIRLTGKMAEVYDVRYRVCLQKGSWVDWVQNGETAGAEDKSSHIEAVQIKLVPKEPQELV